MQDSSITILCNAASPLNLVAKKQPLFDFTPRHIILYALYTMRYAMENSLSICLRLKRLVSYFKHMFLLSWILTPDFWLLTPNF